jgi:hypothetical protein
VLPPLVVAILALIALVWILDPLRRGRAEDVDTAPDHLQDAVAQKEIALTAMVDIENERDLGKLSDADFEILRAEYEREALIALRALEGANNGADAELEAEIAAMRARLGSTSRIPCPDCGTPRTLGGPCPSCGSTSP